MEVRFEDANLAAVEKGKATAGHGGAVDKKFRERMKLIRAAADERDLYALKSLNFEKYADGRRSMRLNDQWRLFIKFEGESSRKVVVIVGVSDPH